MYNCSIQKKAKTLTRGRITIKRKHFTDVFKMKNVACTERYFDIYFFPLRSLKTDQCCYLR